MNLRQCHWAVYFIFWATAVILLGAGAGAIGFALLGPLFGSARTLLQHVITGARHLGFVSMIWAPGIALVLCVMRAHRNKQKR
jgi:hypothetical protein